MTPEEIIELALGAVQLGMAFLKRAKEEGEMTPEQEAKMETLAEELFALYASAPPAPGGSGG